MSSSPASRALPRSETSRASKNDGKIETTSMRTSVLPRVVLIGCGVALDCCGIFARHLGLSIVRFGLVGRSGKVFEEPRRRRHQDETGSNIYKTGRAPGSTPHH